MNAQMFVLVVATIIAALGGGSNTGGVHAMPAQAQQQQLTDLVSDGVVDELDKLTSGKDNVGKVATVPAGDLVVADEEVQELPPSETNDGNQQQGMPMAEDVPMEQSFPQEPEHKGQLIDAGFDKEALSALWDMVQQVEDSIHEDQERQEKRNKGARLSGRVQPLAPHRVNPDEFSFQAMQQKFQEDEESRMESDGDKTDSQEADSQAQDAEQQDMAVPQSSETGPLPGLSVARLPAYMQRNALQGKIRVNDGALSQAPGRLSNNAKNGGLLAGVRRLHLKSASRPGGLVQVGPKTPMFKRQPPAGM